MRRGQGTAGDVVDRDRAEREVGAHPVDQDRRDAAVAHPPESRLDAADGGDEDATHPEFLEEVQVAALALLLAVARAGDHREARQCGRILCRRRDLGEERVAAAESDQPDGVTLADAQLARGLVAHVGELLHGGHDAFDGLGRDDLRPVEHVRYGADRDVRQGGDIFDA